MSFDPSINFSPFPIEESASIFIKTIDRLQANVIISITEQIRRMMPVKPRAGDNPIVVRISHQLQDEKKKLSFEQILSCSSFFEPQPIEKQTKKKGVFDFFKKFGKNDELLPCFIVSIETQNDTFDLKVDNPLLLNNKKVQERPVLQSMISLSDMTNPYMWQGIFVQTCQNIKAYIEKDRWMLSEK